MTKFTKIESLINSVVEVVGNTIKDFGRFPKKRQIIIAATILIIIEESVRFAIKKFDLNLAIPIYYNYAFWIIVVVLIVWAVRIKIKEKDIPINLDYHSPIKGPLSFEDHDEEIFKKLQRNSEISVYIDALYRPDFKIGIITGVSGCGKSSLLKAGLAPAINSDKYLIVVITFVNKSIEKTIIDGIRESIPDLNHRVDHSLDQFVKLANNNIRPKILILVFDQFEQLYTQYSLSERQLFIKNLKNIYDENNSTKMLISIRSDFLDNLHELQEQIDYVLNATKNYFRLQNFTPDQAVIIFKVIAQLENIKNTDDSFLISFAKNELASNKDGLISPVDIQIALLVIKRNHPDNDLTASTFERLGGFQGILKKYLDDELNVPNTFNRDGDVLNTLVSLIDANEYVRAGQLTLQEIKGKNLIVHEEGLESILKLLVELRIVHFIEVDKKYELAHEKLIEPILAIYNRTNTALQKANILLELRVNEWIGNNRKKSYLLNLREYFFISKYQKSITWGSKELLKKDLLHDTLLKIKKTGINAISVFLLLIIGYLIVDSSWYIKNYKIKSEILNYVNRNNGSSLSYGALYGLVSVDPKLTYKLSEFNNHLL
ncbi:MAG TPA: hypothetical protein VGI43_14060 [Mucilaginibacter sp.]|jgi:hypothetical protein